MKQTSDPSAAVRADPKRPTECPECGSAVEFECGAWWCTRKRCKHFNKFVISVGDQPHVPAPANEHQDHSPAEIEQERGEVFKVLPPLEIADHADALGWTPESRVWGLETGRPGWAWVYPSGQALIEGNVYPAGFSEQELPAVNKIKLLPNRRVQGEGEDEPTVAGGVKLPDHLRRTPEEMASTPKTATAWDGGVTIQNDYLRMATDAPDGKAFMWCKSNPLETLRRMVDEYVAEREKMAVAADRANIADAVVARMTSPRPAKSAGEVAEEVWKQQNSTPIPASLQAWMVAAIERERGSR